MHELYQVSKLECGELGREGEKRTSQEHAGDVK